MTGSFPTLWAVHPKPIGGEALSSWVSRIALGLGHSLQQFRKLTLPKSRGETNDLDLIGNLALFEALSASTGVSPEDVQQTSLAGDEGWIFARIEARPNWIVPLRMQDQYGRYTAMPFCPSCLANDSTPFYRKRWRYAFHPVCPEHGLLTNRCPNCGHPYAYVGPDRIGDAVCSGKTQVCRQCQAKFKVATVQGLSDRALEGVVAAQGELLAALDSGWADLQSVGPIHICLYLEGLHAIASLFEDAKLGPKILAYLVSQTGWEPPEWSRLNWLGPVESRSQTIQSWTLLLTTWLTREWPDRFVALGKAAGLPASRLFPKGCPQWIAESGIGGLPASTGGGQQFEAAKRVLVRLMQWPPTDADVQRFMRTGLVPAIQPLGGRTRRQEPLGLFSNKSDSSDQRKASACKSIYPPIMADLAQAFEADIEEAGQDSEGVRHLLIALQRSRRRSGTN